MMRLQEVRARVTLMKWELFTEFSELSSEIEVILGNSKSRKIGHFSGFVQPKKISNDKLRGVKSKHPSFCSSTFNSAEVSEQTRVIGQIVFLCSLFVCRTIINILDIFGTLMCMRRKHLKCIKISETVTAEDFCVGNFNR